MVIFNDRYQLFLFELQSVAYTAVPFFAVGAIWFVIFGLSLSFICICYCCCRREPYGYSRVAYALSLILLTFFTIAAMYSLSLSLGNDVDCAYTCGCSL